mgnify:FL=1
MTYTQIQDTLQRLLLAQAVQRAALQNDIMAVDRNYGASGISLPDDFHCFSIGGILTIDRHENRMIDQQEIRISRRQDLLPPSFGSDRLRRIQGNHFQKRPAVRGAHSAERMDIFFQDIVIRTAGRRGRSKHRILADKAGNRINMSVGIIAGKTAVQPEHLLDAEGLAENLLRFGLGDSGIPVLIQNYRPRREKIPCPVNFKRTPFADKRNLKTLWLPMGV